MKKTDNCTQLHLPVSNCCQAGMEVGGSTTQYHICRECYKACDYYVYPCCRTKGGLDNLTMDDLGNHIQEEPPQDQEWEEKFDEMYDINNVAEWTVGIIASALTHAKIKRAGADASHITKKLRKLVDSAVQKAREEERKKHIDTAFDVAHATLDVQWEARLEKAIKKERERAVSIIDDLIVDCDDHSDSCTLCSGNEELRTAKELILNPKPE